MIKRETKVKWLLKLMCQDPKKYFGGERNPGTTSDSLSTFCPPAKEAPRPRRPKWLAISVQELLKVMAKSHSTVWRYSYRLAHWPGTHRRNSGNAEPVKRESSASGPVFVIPTIPFKTRGWRIQLVPPTVLSEIPILFKPRCLWWDSGLMTLVQVSPPMWQRSLPLTLLALRASFLLITVCH